MNRYAVSGTDTFAGTEEGQMIRIFLLETDENTDPEVMKDLLSLLSCERQEQVRRMRFEADKRLLVYSSVLLRCLACEYLSVPNGSLHFSKNKFGKPCLPDYPSFRFNISHTRNALAVGLSDTEIGVDIEKKNRADPAVAARVFSGKEISYVFDGENDRDIRFNEVWTRKEALAKRIGTGWSADMKQLDVLSEPVSAEMYTAHINGYTVSVSSADVQNLSEITHVSEYDFFYMVTENIFHGSGCAYIPRNQSGIH